MTEQEKTLALLRPSLDLLFENNFSDMKRLFKTQDDCFLHLMGLTLLRTGLAGITLDKTKFKLAMDTAWKAIEKSNENRKQDAGRIFRSDPNDFSDDECHAELTHSELLALYGGLCTVEDQSLMGFVKAAFKVRSCYAGLKECDRIRRGKTNWKSDVLKEEFCSGVLLDLGLFEMAISFFPRKFVILLELAGFSGNRSFGLDKLETAAAFPLSIRKLAAMVALVGYHMFAEYFYGLGEIKRDLIMDILKFGSELYPKSVYAVLIRGLMENVAGNFPIAMQHYDTMVMEPETPRGMKYVLFYLRAWLSAMQCNWVEAMNNSRLLKDECKWSRSLFTFMYAIFASQVLKTSKDQELEKSMREALIAVPMVKRHFGGKRAFHEKIVIEKAALYVHSPDRMILPQLDLMYLWNLFIQASHHPASLKKIKLMIEQELENVKKDDDPELVCYLTFMRGCVYAACHYDAIATDCFLQVISLRELILQEKHLVPQACFEMGMLYRRSGDVEESKKWFRKAKKFTGYLTEAMITFRVDCALGSYDKHEKRDA